MESETTIRIDSFSIRVTLDCRGEHIIVYKHILAKSVYFALIFKTVRDVDTPIFVDCDIDAFRELLAYMEFGRFRTQYFSMGYLKDLCDKFGIDGVKEQIRNNKLEKEKKLRQDELIKLEHLTKSKQQKIDQFKQELLDSVATLIERGVTDFYIEFIPGENNVIVADTHIICTHDMCFFRTIQSLLRSHELRILFFKPVIPENNYVARYTSIDKLKEKRIEFILEVR